jgi:hypothetical protein
MLMGWLSGWAYRKSHVINPATGAGTGYQVKITVHYGSGTDSGGDVYLNGKCRTDFGDIRFTKSDGITLLDYWMESEVDGDNAVFWVEIADDLSATPQRIFIYYGNASATTTSNFTNTMITLSANPTFTAYGSYQPTTYNIQENPDKTLVPDEDYGDMRTYDVWNGQDEGCYWIWDFGSVASRGFRIKWKASATRYSTYCVNFTVTIYLSADGSTWTLIDSYQFTSGGTKPVGISEGCGSYRYVKVDQHSTTACMVVYGYTYVDAVYARKYVSPEPSHGSWGSEEGIAIEGYRTEGRDFKEAKFMPA